MPWGTPAFNQRRLIARCLTVSQLRKKLRMDGSYFWSDKCSHLKTLLKWILPNFGCCMAVFISGNLGKYFNSHNGLMMFAQCRVLTLMKVFARRSGFVAVIHCQSQMCVTELTTGRFCFASATGTWTRLNVRRLLRGAEELWLLLPPFSLTLITLRGSSRAVCGSSCEMLRRRLYAWQFEVESVALIKAAYSTTMQQCLCGYSTCFDWKDRLRNVAWLTPFRNCVVGVFEKCTNHQALLDIINKCPCDEIHCSEKRWNGAQQGSYQLVLLMAAAPHQRVWRFSERKHHPGVKCFLPAVDGQQLKSSIFANVRVSGFIRVAMKMFLFLPFHENKIHKCSVNF